MPPCSWRVLQVSARSAHRQQRAQSCCAGVDVAMNTHLKQVTLMPKGKNPIKVDNMSVRGSHIRCYILPESLNLDTLLVDIDQPKQRAKRPERTARAHLPFLPLCNPAVGCRMLQTNGAVARVSLRTCKGVKLAPCITQTMAAVLCGMPTHKRKSVHCTTHPACAKSLTCCVGVQSRAGVAAEAAAAAEGAVDSCFAGTDAGMIGPLPLLFSGCGRSDWRSGASVAMHCSAAEICCGVLQGACTGGAASTCGALLPSG